MAVFKRIWRLQIQINDTIKTYKELNYDDTSLKIEFDITNGMCGAFANGNITIYNLNIDDMQYLASSVSPFGKFKRNKISLEVGYLGNLGLLVSGNIIEVDCDFNGGDTRATLKVIGGIANNLSKNSIKTSLKGNIEFKNICNECATKNKMQLFYDKNIANRFINDFSFLGTPFQLIEKLRSYFDDLHIFINETGEILNVLLKENGEIVNTQELSYETGLVGRIKPTMLGCNATSILNINLKAGRHIKLKNKVLKDYDGIYIINEIKHRGSNSGDGWFSDLVLRRVK
ncbi:hypothetical protein [Campylobacter sp.]|uniref:baseplate hub protein n=1 Tax=Campylobacter sp. TaxID=205 RepID=UPI0025C3D6D6|nr:hypothetical protein [Campylobacter sp.]